MFDGSLYPKNRMHMFEYLHTYRGIPVLWYRACIRAMQASKNGNHCVHDYCRHACNRLSLVALSRPQRLSCPSLPASADLPEYCQMLGRASLWWTSSPVHCLHTDLIAPACFKATSCKTACFKIEVQDGACHCTYHIILVCAHYTARAISCKKNNEA
jgi:hypothetical protein